MTLREMYNGNYDAYLESLNDNGKFNEIINGKKYKFYIGTSTKYYNDKTDRAKAIKMAKTILAKEKSIKSQVYALYKGTTKEQFEKDYIEMFEIVDRDDKMCLGVFFTNINQFCTMVKNGKIIPDETFCY